MQIQTGKNILDVFVLQQLQQCRTLYACVTEILSGRSYRRGKDKRHDFKSCSRVE